ncbi:hypothetical protein [Peribacillus butanolivorans]|nr:hypothetical protein [Peribacillus butanolivorans]
MNNITKPQRGIEIKNMEAHPGVAKLDALRQISLFEKETHNA